MGNIEIMMGTNLGIGGGAKENRSSIFKSHCEEHYEGKDMVLIDDYRENKKFGTR